LEDIFIVKFLLLALLAFAAVQQPNPPKPKRKRKVRPEETPATHEVFYQQDKHMTQEIEALATEVKK
jgi:large-conductance mechanosensitive channel